MRQTVRLLTFVAGAALLTSGCMVVQIDRPVSYGAPGGETWRPGSGELARRIAGAQWQWDGASGETVVFRKDGTVEHEGWTARGLVTRWRATDRRTVLLQIEKGRDTDLYAILSFAVDMSSCRGWNFHGGAKIATSRPVEGARCAPSPAERPANGALGPDLGKDIAR